MNRCDERRRRAGAEIADEAREAVVDDVLAAERAAHRQFVLRGEARDVGAGGIAPPAAADQHDRPLGSRQEPAQLGQIGGAGMGAHGMVGADHRGGGAVAQHVLGQGHDDRTGPAGGRDLEGLVEQFRDAIGEVDLRHPFGERRVHLAKIDLLEGLAVDLMARHLADQHDHRRRILERGVHPDRGVASAGAARHQQDARLSGQLPIGLGHEGGAALLAAGHEMDVGRVEQRVEHFEIALAGDAERHPHPMRPQRRDHQLAAAHQAQVRRHRQILAAECALVRRREIASLRRR